MKKKMIVSAMLVLVMLTSVVACAEGNTSLSDFSNRLKKPVQETVAPVMTGDDDGLSLGPAVKTEDPFFQKLRSSAYLREGKYSKEMNVMIELKNTSGRTLYPGTATISAYDANGNLLEEKNYSSVAPEMVADGGSLYIWEQFYSPEYELSSVSYFEAKVETETSSYTSYESIAGQALVDSGIAYALVENTTENDIYGIRATVAVEDNDGNLLDICEVSTGNAIGIFPGSIMILRGNVEDHATGDALTAGNTVVNILYQID